MSKRNRGHKGGKPQVRRLELTGIVRRVDAFSGFFIPDDGVHDDLYLRGSNLGGAQDRDHVRARALGHARPGRRAEGCVVDILERGVSRIVGELKRHGAFHYLLPLASRFYETITVDDSDLRGAKEADRVVAEITNYTPLRARVVETLGPAGTTEVELKTVSARHGITQKFPREVMAEADHLPDEVPTEALKGREDLRHMTVFTIDPADARDLDDAISFEPLHTDGAPRVRLGVHIADVAAYVRPGSAIDREAAERATSIYLVDGVIPMLPTKLSNGICSLHADVDRLTVSVFIDFTPDAKILSARFVRSVIRSRRRFNYDEIDEILEKKTCPPGFDFIPAMAEFSRHIRRRRSERGSIDFDFPEVRLVLDDSGHVKDVLVLHNTISHQLIEEFMISANEAVARHIEAKHMPLIHRAHAEPDTDKILALEQFLRNLGIRSRLLGRDRAADSEGPARNLSRRLQALLDDVKGGPWERVVNYQMLRSLPKAQYGTRNLGHFGLASSCYCHFTSPIRRYPDLSVHRSLIAVLEGRSFSKSEISKWAADLAGVARHSTQKEIEAADAERESVKVKLLEDMQTRTGHVFTGTVAGVVSFGLFVQLPNTSEGLIHVSTMRDDQYQLSEMTASLVGRKTGKTFRIGDTVQVRVERVDLPLRQLDLSLVV